MPGKLTYFDGIGARAESIRSMIAHKGGFDFEEEKVTFP